MKSLKLVSVICLLSVFGGIKILNAQNTSGKIYYDRIIAFSLDGTDIPEAVKAKIPTSTSSQFVLLYNDKSSLFREVNETEKAMNESVSDQNVRIKIYGNSGEGSVYYNDHSEKQITICKNFLGRNFLISEKDETIKWKIMSDTKVVNGYKCVQAKGYTTKDTIEVWYTPEIPYSIGPESFYGLPGTVLEVSMNDGKVRWVATKIDFSAFDIAEIAKPTKGKKVTMEQFNKIREEKEKEMNEGGGSGDKTIIIKSVK